MAMRRYALLASTLGLAACQTVSPGFQVNFLRTGTPSIAGQDPHMAMAIVTVVRQKPQLQVQNLTGLTFDHAALTLSGRPITGNQTNTVAIAPPSGGNTTVTTAATVFQALPPGSGYDLKVGLTNGGNTVANGENPSITLQSGLNHVTVIIAQNGQTTISNDSQSLNTNPNGNGSPWVIFKGDTVTLNTGFAASEPGPSGDAVASMQIQFGSTMYHGASSPIAVSGVTSGYNAYSFASGTNLGTGDGSKGNYDAGDLTLETSGDTIEFDLLDAGGNIIGISKLSDVEVLDLASFDLTLE